MEFNSTAKISKKAFSKRGLSALDIPTESQPEVNNKDKVTRQEQNDPHISGDEEGTRVLQSVNNAIALESSDSDVELDLDARKRLFRRKKKKNIKTKSGLFNEDASDVSEEIEKYKASLAEMSKQLDSSTKAFTTREANLKRQRDDALDEINTLRNKV